MTPGTKWLSWRIGVQETSSIRDGSETGDLGQWILPVLTSTRFDRADDGERQATRGPQESRNSETYDAQQQGHREACNSQDLVVQRFRCFAIDRRVLLGRQPGQAWANRPREQSGEVDQRSHVGGGCGGPGNGCE